MPSCTIEPGANVGGDFARSTCHTRAVPRICGIHLQLKFPASLKMKVYAQQSGGHEQDHRQLHDQLRPSPRECEVEDDNDEANGQQHERQPLRRILVVRDERQLGEESRHAEDQHAKDDAPDGNEFHLSRIR